jgi:predicted membrane protein
MKLPSPLLSLLVNFLLGASWAFAFLGATSLFSLFLSMGIVYAFLGALVGLIPGLFLVLLIEYVFMKQELLNEAKKQTKLLEELVNKS